MQSRLPTQTIDRSIDNKFTHTHTQKKKSLKILTVILSMLKKIDISLGSLSDPAQIV